MTSIALIDYGSGNIHSARRALLAAGDLAGVACDIHVTADPEHVAAADRIVLPGVGHYADCAKNLHAQDGLVAALDEAVRGRGIPFLGICVGMQLLAEMGREDGETPGLGWVPGVVDKIAPGPDYRIPHMGWNGLTITRPHPVLEGLGEDPHVYFVHSYAFNDPAAAAVCATTDYDGPIAATVAKDNLFGTQFHPEKSQKTGLKLLSNFITWTP